MPKLTKKVGEFELLVLLAILRQEDSPYANRIREDIETNAHRNVTRGALYRTLDRLKAKGMIEWDLVPSQVPERGGHAMRKLRVTELGTSAAQAQHAILTHFFEGLDPLTEGR